MADTSLYNSDSTSKSDVETPKTPKEALLKYVMADNVADLLTDDELRKIGDKCYRHYKVDEATMGEWNEIKDYILKIAKQVHDKKNEPWENATNVKYPLITTACIHFASRIYPEIIRDGKVAKYTVTGKDDDGKLQQLADKLREFVSYQLLEQSDSWEPQTDQLLHVLPLIGTAFKKVYYDPICKKNCSDLCSPDEIIINNNVPSLDEARRVSHIVYKYDNDIIEYQRAGLYLNVDLRDLKDQSIGSDEDKDKPRKFIEQHCYLDLDGDKYQEPYIVTFHEESRKVVRIEPRFDLDGIHFTDDEQVAYIEANNFFVDYHCIRSPDGKFFSLGLGTLLLPINETINNTMNQMLDAGHLSNLPSGFLGRGIRFKGGNLRLKPGEWKGLEGSPGVDIKNNIVPLPSKEPSQVLFNLLGLMIDAGKQLSSVSDVMMGEAPQANTPATSTLAAIDQGLQVFGSIQKRLFRSLRKELELWHKLNGKYLNGTEYIKVLNDQKAVGRDDFSNKQVNVLPIADPNQSSEAQRLLKAQALLQLMQTAPGVINGQAAVTMYLQALRYSENQIKSVINPPPPPDAPPPPEVQKILSEVEHNKVKSQVLIKDVDLKAQELKQNQEKLQIEASKALSSHQKAQVDSTMDLKKTDLEEKKANMEHSIRLLEKKLEEMKINFDAKLKEKELSIKEKEIKMRPKNTNE